MADKDKDAFDLNDEDFEKVMSGDSDEFILTSDDDTGETDAGETDASETDAGETDAGETDAGETDDTELSGDDVDLSSLFEEDEDTQGADKGNNKGTDEDLIDLVYNGNIVKVTRAEATDLAQKGYDYQEKTARIAPRRKLLDLIDADDELQGMINKHVAGKVTPDVTKREDYETEEEWLQDNMNNAVASTNPLLTKAAETSGQEQPAEAPIVAALRSRDPQNFDRVAPVLTQAISQLTVGQYTAITADPAKVVKFYDTVKQQVLKPNSQSNSAPKKKTFNLRSGQGPNNRSKPPAKKNVWELGNKEFNSVLRKVKGF